MIISTSHGLTPFNRAFEVVKATLEEHYFFIPK